VGASEKFVMDKARKKEIARAYAERRRVQGVFAVRCAATGEVWVASSRNLDTQRNGVWFALRTGGHPNKAAQAAWNAHGEQSFAYEIIEVLSADSLTPMGLSDLLKTRERHWREALGAGALVG
jgi:hypothetical protein